MADFLWTSKTLGPTASVAEHILKYCFNAPGNWRKWNSTTFSWEETTDTPGKTITYPMDTCYIGVGNDPGRGKNRTGWTAAKHPLLFGGVSGNSEAGYTGVFDWRLGAGASLMNGSVNNFYYSVGITHISGGRDSVNIDIENEYSTFKPYKQVGTTEYPIIDYPFPYLGNGITLGGEVALWCAARDGISADSYVIANYSGWHNPENGLRLRVNERVILEDLRIAGLPGGTTNPFMANITFYPQYVSPPGVWGDPKGGISTEMLIHGFNGSGFRIVGGKFKRIVANRFAGGFEGFYTTLEQVGYRGIGSMSALRPYRHIDVIDRGIQLVNTTTDKLIATNLQKLSLYGGNYAYVDLVVGGSAISHYYQNKFQTAVAMDRLPVGRKTLPDGSIGGVTWTMPTDSGAEIKLANNWDWTIPYAYAYGISGDALETTDPRYTGVLNISSLNTLSNDADNGTRWGLLDAINREPGTLNYSTRYFQYPGNTLQTWEFGNIDTRKRASCPVILGDPDDQGFAFGFNPGGTANTSWGVTNLTRVNVVGGYAYETDPVIFGSSVPPRLYLASPGYIHTLNVKAAIVEPHPYLAQTSQVKIGQLEMSLASRVYLDNKDIRFGFLTYLGAGNKAYLIGGARSSDWTQNMIFADANHAFWGSAIRSNRLVRNNPDGFELTESPKPSNTTG